MTSCYSITEPQPLAYLRPGDTLVVWRLDQLGRSLKHLIETITTLHDRHIGFKSITGNIDGNGSMSNDGLPL